MEKTIKILLKEIIQENNYNITLDDIKINVTRERNFTIIIKNTTIETTMSSNSDLKRCLQSILNNYADEHQI
jgi:hypothetical protein